MSYSFSDFMRDLGQVGGSMALMAAGPKGLKAVFAPGHEIGIGKMFRQLAERQIEGQGHPRTPSDWVQWVHSYPQTDSYLQVPLLIGMTTLPPVEPGSGSTRRLTNLRGAMISGGRNDGFVKDPRSDRGPFDDRGSGGVCSLVVKELEPTPRVPGKPDHIGVVKQSPQPGLWVHDLREVRVEWVDPAAWKEKMEARWDPARAVPVPIYVHQNAVPPDKRLYTASTDTLPGWNRLGIAFRALDPQDPRGLPIVEHRSSDDRRLYTVDTSFIPGWQPRAIIGYASEAPDPSDPHMVPIYQYQSRDDRRLYAVDDDIHKIDAGWNMLGADFYAYGPG